MSSKIRRCNYDIGLIAFKWQIYIYNLLMYTKRWEENYRVIPSNHCHRPGFLRQTAVRRLDLAVVEAVELHLQLSPTQVAAAAIDDLETAHGLDDAAQCSFHVPLAHDVSAFS